MEQSSDVRLHQKLNFSLLSGPTFSLLVSFTTLIGPVSPYKLFVFSKNRFFYLKKDEKKKTPK